MPALASKGSRCLRDPWPDPADDLTHRGQPKLRLQQLEPLEDDWMEPNQPLIGAEKGQPQARVESHPPQAKVERHPPPTRAVNQPPQAEVRNQPPQESLSTRPQRGKEWAMVPGPTGTKGPSVGLKVEPLSPKGLPIQLGQHRQGGRPSVKFTTA